MLTYFPPPDQLQQDRMADARSYAVNRLRFADKRYNKNLTVTKKTGITWSLKFLNMKKNEFSGHRSQYPKKKMSF